MSTMRGLRGKSIWLLLAAAFSVMALVTRQGDAASDAFTNTTTGGSWETGGNWSLGIPPGAADSAFLTNTGTYTVNIDNTTANTDPGVGGWLTNTTLLIGNSSGLPTLVIDFTNIAKSLTLTSTTFIPAALSIGDTAGTSGALVMNNGILNTTGGFELIGRTGTGTLTLNNGLIQSKYQMVGANAGSSGTLLILGGTNRSNNGYLDLGDGTGATGRVVVAGGYLQVTNGTTYLGYYGYGNMIVSNGLVDLSTVWMGSRAGGGTVGQWDIYGGTSRVYGSVNGLYLGQAAGNTGIVNIAGGLLDVKDYIAAIGNAGVGLMTVSNGTFNSKYVQVGSLPGSTGQLDIRNGTNTSTGGYYYVGNSAGATGTVNLAGGLLLVDYADTYIGSYGRGTVNVSNGLFRAAQVYIGQNAGGVGELNISGGKAYFTNSYASYGMLMGYLAGSTGTVNITGGELVVTNLQNRIANNGIATVNISNGAYYARWQVLGANAGSKGVINVYNGGSNILTSSALDIGSNAGATGIVNVAGGVFTVADLVNSSTYIGDWGRGVINQTSGDVTLGYTYMGQLAGASGEWNIGGGTGRVAGVGNIIYIGNVGGSTGIVNVSNGRLELQQAMVGYSGSAYGELNVSGGSVVMGVTGPYSLNVGYQAGSTGRVQLTGGEIIATNNYVAIGNAGNGTMVISNGTFRGKYQAVGVSPGPNGGGSIYQYGGSNILQNGYWDIGTNPGATGRVLIAGGYVQVTNGITYIGDYGHGTLTVSNGTVTLGEVRIAENPSGGGYGEWNIYGGTNRAGVGGSLLFSIGYSAKNTGVVNVAGGLLEAPEYVTFIGASGRGVMNISNGTFNSRYQQVGVYGGSSGELNVLGGTNVSSSGYVYIANVTGSTGTVLVAGGLLRFTNEPTYLGYQGRGSITVSNGVFQANTLEAGAASGGFGTFNTHGGLSSLNSTLTVGNAAGGTGNVLVADAGILELRSSTVVGGSGTGAITNRDGGTIRFTDQNNPTITKNASGTLISTNAIVEFKDVAAASLFGGVTNITLLGNNTFSLNNASNAILGSYTFQNNTPATYASLRMINGTTRWQSTNLTIAGGSSMLASNTIGSVRGIVTNAGTITVMNSKMTFENSVLISGSFVSDPSTNTFLADVTVSSSGTLVGGAGDLFDFKNSLYINSTNRFGFDLDKSAVMFSGGGLHTNAITGRDYSTNDLGFFDNFAYGELHLGSVTDQVCFTCGNIPTIASNGLYIGWLDLLGNSSLVTNLHAPTSIHLYYDKTDARNAYLGGLSYSLTDCDLLSAGGSLIPVIPEPSMVSLFAVVAFALLRRKQHRQ